MIFFRFKSSEIYITVYPAFNNTANDFSLVPGVWHPVFLRLQFSTGGLAPGIFQGNCRNPWYVSMPSRAYTSFLRVCIRIM